MAIPPPGIVEDSVISDDHQSASAETSTPEEETDSRTEVDVISTIRPGVYGWGRFTPKWLQTFNKPEWLLACFCFAVFSSTLAGALMPAITDTLERRFHLNSVRSGLLNSSYDIASFLIVLFVCHYGERGHKGKWISVGAIVYGLGSCIMTIPHYTAETYHPISDGYHSNDTCPSSYPQDACTSTDGSTSSSYYILLAGQAVRGFGGTCLGTLMLAYIDENVTQRTSPFYIAILSVVGLIAMAAGFMLGGQFLHLYSEFDRLPRDQWPDPSDPNWYGCWWMGYYIGGISAFMISIALLGFPKELPSKIRARQLDRQQAHSDEEEQHITGTGFAQNWSELPRLTWSLVKNPVFSCFTLRNTIEVAFGTGWGVFMPKYLQNMYGMDPGYSAMVTGGICLGPIMAGTLIGGWIIKRFNWKVRGVLFFGFVTTVLGSFTSLGILSNCHTKLIAGANVDYAGNIIPKATGVLLDSCNANCSCDTTTYDPVCFEEADITYYSSCFAGCSESVTDPAGKTKYLNCECLKRHFPTLTSTYSVVAGACPTSETPYCIGRRNWFIGTWVMTCLFFGMSGMPLVQSFLRAVPFSQRTLALGLQSIPMRMLGSVPGPILMGYMFDYSCILWKSRCENTKYCLQYDNEIMMRLTVYVGVFIRIASAALLLLAILLYRPPKSKSVQSNGTVMIGIKGAEEEYAGSILDTLIRMIRQKYTIGDKR